MAATAQGSEDATPRGADATAPDSGAGKGAPTGFPQRWQKLAPGDSIAAHPAQETGSRVAPQFAQNRPEPGVLQTGQTV